MHLFAQYLKPFKWYIALALLLAGVAQILMLYDPIIFGKIIDNYALNPNGKDPNQLIDGVLRLLILAIGIALTAQLFTAFKDYVLRMVVQKFGMQIFNDGLRQTIRLPFQEFEDQSSGEILSILQKVRADTEKFLTSSINILFSSIVGIGFLIWYAVTKHWALIPVFLVGVVLLGGLTSILSRSIKTLQRSLIRQNRQMSGTITESLRNYRTRTKPRTDLSRNPPAESSHPGNLRSRNVEGQKDAHANVFPREYFDVAQAINTIHLAVADFPRCLVAWRIDIHAIHIDGNHRAATGFGKYYHFVSRSRNSAITFQ